MNFPRILYSLVVLEACFGEVIRAMKFELFLVKFFTEQFTQSFVLFESNHFAFFKEFSCEKACACADFKHTVPRPQIRRINQFFYHALVDHKMLAKPFLRPELVFHHQVVEF